jgi:hypothetical protein
MVPKKPQTAISAHNLCWASEVATVAQVAMDFASLIITEKRSAEAHDQPDQLSWSRLLGSPVLRTGHGCGGLVRSNVVCEFVVLQERPLLVK